MTARTERLRRASLDAIPSISGERAAITTAFYKAQMGRHSIPVLRAMNFYAICDGKTLWMGDGELIVGERGPRPKAVPTYPELTCHSAEDLRILDSRPRTQYKVDASVIAEYEREIIPFWRGRSLRDQMFSELPQDWLDAYAAGCFTEFMEQRAPGHTVADGKLYRKGMLDFKADIARAEAALDFERDPEALDKREQLRAMSIACDAVIRFAGRHEHNRFVRVIMAPGLALQWMTTKQPDSAQIEVAIVALEKIIELEPQDRPPVKGVEVMA